MQAVVLQKKNAGRWDLIDLLRLVWSDNVSLNAGRSAELCAHKWYWSFAMQAGKNRAYERHKELSPAEMDDRWDKISRLTLRGWRWTTSPRVVEDEIRCARRKKVSTLGSGITSRNAVTHAWKSYVRNQFGVPEAHFPQAGGESTRLRASREREKPDSGSGFACENEIKTHVVLCASIMIIRNGWFSRNFFWLFSFPFFVRFRCRRAPKFWFDSSDNPRAIFVSSWAEMEKDINNFHEREWIWRWWFCSETRS